MYSISIENKHKVYKDLDIPLNTQLPETKRNILSINEDVTSGGLLKSLSFDKYAMVMIHVYGYIERDITQDIEMYLLALVHFPGSSRILNPIQVNPQSPVTYIDLIDTGYTDQIDIELHGVKDAVVDGKGTEINIDGHVELTVDYVIV